MNFFARLYNLKLIIATTIIFYFIFHLPLLLYSTNLSFNKIEDNIRKADAFLNILKYDSAELYYLQVMPGLKGIDKRDLYCSVVNKYTTTLWQQGKLAEAEKTAYLNLDNCNKYMDPDDPVYGDCLLNAGIVCFLTGNIGMTTVYLKKANVIYEKNYGHWNSHTAKSHEWLGTVYEHISDTANAYYYLNESFKIWKKILNINHPDLGNIHRYLGLYYKRFGKLDSAQYYFSKAKVLFDKKYGVNNYKSVKCLNNICDVYEVLGNFDTAIIIYDYALELLNKSDAPNRHAKMMTLFNIAEMYQNMGKTKMALQYFQKIFPLYFPSFNDEDILINPKDIDEYPFNIIKIILFYKARNLTSLYEEDTLNHLSYLKSANECYTLANEIIDMMRMRINDDELLISHENLYAGLMLEMAENAIKLYQHTGNTNYFSIALNYIEKNRNLTSIKLRGSTLGNNIDVPYNTKQNGLQLQNEYNTIKNQILNSQNSEQTDSLDNILLDKKIEMDIFKRKVCDTYPAIKHLKNFDNSFTLNDIQAKLKSNQVLIQYSERCNDYISAPYEIIAIAILKDEIKYFYIDGSKAYKLINDYYYQVSRKDKKTKIDSIGYLLSELLFDPIRGIIKNKEIIIIPSQYTSLVPFDALPAERAESNKVHYMIEDHTIWKTFSVSNFLKENNISKPSHEQVLAMAPGFTKSKKMQIAMLTKRDTSLIELSGALSECKEINRFFNTKLVTGFDATENEFKSLSGHYPIIHISTHGVPDANDETMVKLAFSKNNDSKEDGFLNNYEIFNLNLNADLIVLSACKTGVGELNKGAGNLSLAWAFMKAGAQSSVISLWDANDYASSVIMPGFYRYLSEGNTKPEALRKAKLDFINSSDDLTSNPYFWAGFEYYGNDTRILVSDNKVPIMIIVSVILIGLVLTFLALRFHPFNYYRIKDKNIQIHE